MEQRPAEPQVFPATDSMMLWVSFLGGYIARIRSKLASKNNVLAEAQNKLHDISIHDELTGAFNRHHLMDIIEHEKEQVVNRSKILS